MVTDQHLNCSHPQFSHVFVCGKSGSFILKEPCHHAPVEQLFWVALLHVRPWALWCHWHVNIGTAVALWAQRWHHILKPCHMSTSCHVVTLYNAVFFHVCSSCMLCLRNGACWAFLWFACPEYISLILREHVRLLFVSAWEPRRMWCRVVSHGSVGCAAVFNTFKKQMYLHNKRWWLMTLKSQKCR